jgi:ABC-2 type transport system permease protein
MNDTALQLPPATIEPSLWRAWFYLVRLSWQRQARAHQMVWIALALLVFAIVFVGLNTALNRWDLHNRRWPPGTQPAGKVELSQWKLHNLPLPANGEPREVSYTGDAADAVQLWFWMSPFGLGGVPRANPILAAYQATLNQMSLKIYVFVYNIVFFIFLNFLLPLWSMSFAMEAMGGDREGNNLIWLLTRPLPRPAIYVGKFVAMLPWTLALNLGGFGLMCLAGGRPGRETFALLWLSVLCGSLAFSSLFFFIGVFFRRPAIVSIVYTFFLEIILSKMPGYLNRISLTFYTKCMMYAAVQRHGIEPQRTDVFPVVSGSTACAVLLSASIVFVLLGMFWFARKEYHEIS